MYTMYILVLSYYDIPTPLGAKNEGGGSQM